jgi:2-dehydropantoate 2-reductase
MDDGNGRRGGGRMENAQTVGRQRGEPDVVIVGGGAMGCLFGALFCRCGRKVVLKEAQPERVAALRGAGVTLREGGRSETFELEVIRDSAELDVPEGGVLRVMFCVKAFDTRRAAEQCRSLVGPRTTVLTVQNGLGNVEALAAGLGAGVLLAGTTSLGANLVEATTVEFAGTGEVHIGPAAGIARTGIARAGIARTGVEKASAVESASSGSADAVSSDTEEDAVSSGSTDEAFAGTEDADVRAALDATAALFEAAAVPVRKSSDVARVIWSKLVVNVGINALTALLRVRNGALLELAPARTLMERAVDEALAVAAACNVKLDAEGLRRQVAAVAHKTARNRSSMLMDFLMARRTEIAQINGAVVARGCAHGVDTPVNGVLCDLVEAFSAAQARSWTV